SSVRNFFQIIRVIAIGHIFSKLSNDTPKHRSSLVALHFINRTKTSVVSQIIVVCCVYLRLLNSCNLVIVFLYRQRDLRHAAVRCIKNQFFGRKNHVQSIKICPNN
ncbi:unnamed protein product, partial [Onchocerca flexuosa]|uniref:Secreted protein n=1 Tax=Onchocerca flexuosa TaxID=387005 RepID=A0A183HU15_9BILA